jgi:hypothetical protein
MENTFIEYPQHLRKQIKAYVRFWSKPSLRGHLMDKGGTFNINLYLDYLDAIREQPQRYVKKSC